MKRAILCLFLALIMATSGSALAQEEDTDQTFYNYFTLHVAGVYGAKMGRPNGYAIYR